MEENKKCDKCESLKIEEEVKNFSKNNDNVLKRTKCKNCGFEKDEVEHIG